MATNFLGFSSDSFEQFARSLALAVFGPGVTAFGNGPDGGREATFSGKIPYPYPPTDCWSGYGVIQAKYKEKLESTEKDQTWALDYLQAELDLFASSEKRQPSPDYYVYVTNVELSSASGGAKDKANNLVRSYYARLSIKDHAIWDANQLAAFVAEKHEIRRSYIAYLTPGDILAAMLEDIEKRRPHAGRILTMFLDRELRADESARLDQAGKKTEEQLRLARLFFDLPASPQSSLDPPNEMIDAAGRLPPGVLSELLRAGSRKLDPQSTYDQESLRTQFGLGSRYVLLGGPGSGKSTVGQFLAQIHRAALLNRCQPHLLEPQTRHVINETRELCEQEGLPWPATPRFPFRVELNRFAKALAPKDSHSVPSLGRYLLNTLKGDQSLELSDLLDWLAKYPWLLILDGLDEVPPTSNRAPMVKAIEDFLAEARQCHADLFVIATSRQQGYAGEFAGPTVCVRHILPLSPTRALRYVKRYAEARFGGSDPTRKQDLIDTLAKSAERDLTAQLMLSPLQVTFMATVIGARGDPGEDRWQLFDSYYRTIYDRERQKAVPPYDIVLSKQQSIIDRLHHDIGFWLQSQGEATSDAAVSISRQSFKALVDIYLSGVGHDGDEKDALVRLITDAADYRLIFLTSRIEGELSFEVRSLQEYMAAECLLTGESDLVRSRLRAIADSTYWRNVFLFAAGKCYGDARSRHLQDTVPVLCSDLNNVTDPLLAATQAGSELALDLLQSGVVAQFPNHGRLLARIALELLRDPFILKHPAQDVVPGQRLAAVYRDHLGAIYSECLELRVGQSALPRALGAWPTLLALASTEIQWAIALTERCWPIDVLKQSAILQEARDEHYCGNEAVARMALLLPKLAPSEAISFSARGPRHIGQKALEIRGVSQVLDQLDRALVQIPISLRSGSQSQRIAVMPLFAGEENVTRLFGQLSEQVADNPMWRPYVLAVQLLSQPDKCMLARLLSRCADDGWPTSTNPSCRLLPWPLADCLATVRSSEELRQLANLVAQGQMGDTAEWQEAEKRWAAKGIDCDDIVLGTCPTLERTSCLVTEGGPYYWSRLRFTISSVSDETLQELISIAERVPSDRRKSNLVWILLHSCAAATSGSVLRAIEPERLRALLDSNSVESHGWSENIVECPIEVSMLARWLEFFEWLGSEVRLGSYHSFAEGKSGWPKVWESTFQADPSHVGLLRLLGRLATRGHVCEIEKGLLAQERFDAPRFKLAALLLRLTQKDLPTDEASELAVVAGELLTSQADKSVDRLICATAGRNSMRVPAIETFLLCLRDCVSPDSVHERAEINRILREIRIMRASGLQTPGTIEKLQLPRNLGD